MELILSRNDVARIADATADAVATRILAKIQPVASGPKEWLTNREVMDFLGLSKTSLQRYRSSGRLPFSKIGGNIYYRYVDLVAVLEENMQP